MNLVVYSSGTRVGTLDMVDGEPFYGFTYDKAYLALGRPAALSLSLPLQEQRFSGAQALPFFEGLLPEGDVRASIARQLGISEHSPAKLLRALGKDCAGDVAVLEEDDPYQPPADDAYAHLDDELVGIARNPFGEISRLRVGNRLSLAGGQEKISLYHNRYEGLEAGWYVPLEGSPSTHIVKPQVQDAYPQLVYNEFFCMKLAKRVGVDAANVSVVSYERPLLIIERFDRERTGAIAKNGLDVYRRVRQEDFCQALGFDSSRKYEQDGGPSIASMCNLVLAHSASALRDRNALLRLVLFNYFIGNCDAHAKNYALMLGATDSIKLAPAYDLVSTAVYDGRFGAELSRGMGMRIGDHANIDRITREDFAVLAHEVGVSEKWFMRGAVELSEAMLACIGDVADEMNQVANVDTSELVSRVRVGVEKRARIAG